ncbi:hypothetical protein BJ912DRAFT_1011061, partial [Pholiota molesta]
KHLAPPRSSSPPRPHSCSTTPPPRWRLSSSKSPRPRRRWTHTHAPAPAEQPESATPAASAEVMHAAASVAAALLLGPPAGDDLDLDAFLHDLGVDKPQPAVVDASANTQDTHTCRRRQPGRVPDGGGEGGRNRGERAIGLSSGTKSGSTSWTDALIANETVGRRTRSWRTWRRGVLRRPPSSGRCRWCRTCSAKASS